MCLQGKVKSMVENPGGEPLDPTPNYDCHVAKSSNIPPSASPQATFESTQVRIELVIMDKNWTCYIFGQDIASTALTNMHVKNVF